MASDVSQRAREALDAACDGLVAEVAAMINATPEQRRALSYAEAEMRRRIASLDMATLVSDATAIERERCADAFEQAIARGYSVKAEKCEHNRYAFEECITCYDAALTDAVAAIRKGPTT